jgi:hypothetical protein
MREDIAATTAASARHTTAVTTPGRTALADRGLTGGRLTALISCSSLGIHALE